MESDCMSDAGKIRIIEVGIRIQQTLALHLQVDEAQRAVVDCERIRGPGGKRNFRLQVSDTGLARNPNYKGLGLLLEFTVEDPGVFTTAWSARITYRRPLGSWPEFVCAESTRNYVGRTINLPHADKPDFFRP
jgi:hypothetical protein